MKNETRYSPEIEADLECYENKTRTIAAERLLRAIAAAKEALALGFAVLLHRF